MIAGVDASNVNGVLSWPSLAREHSLSFVFFKATEGRGFKDPLFPAAWQVIGELGLIRAAYHFAHPATDAAAQADAFLSYVRSAGLTGTDILALDLEVTDGRPPGAVAAWAQEWCSLVHAEAARPVLVYTFLDFAWQGNCAGLGGYPLWIADPSSTPGSPRVPAPWTSWAVHQYGQQGLDLDVANYPDPAAMTAALTAGTQPDPQPGGWTTRMIADLPTLAEGVTDKDLPHWYVRRLQLLARGVFGCGGLVPDGVFGPQTKAAVVSIQQGAGLAADGIVGPLTWGFIITGNKS